MSTPTKIMTSGRIAIGGISIIVAVLVWGAAYAIAAGDMDGLGRVARLAAAWIAGVATGLALARAAA